MAHEVFISYVSSDRDASEAVCAILEKNKIRCWLAPRDVLPGVTYGKAIIDAIATSRLLLLILSARSNESPHVVREVERAVHHEIAILPLRIEEVVPTGDMEFFLSATHWLDALPPPLAGHLARLAGVVQHLLRLEGVGPAEKGDSPGRPPEIRKERAEHPARDVPRPRIAAILGQWLSSSDTKLRAQAVDEIGKREMAEQAEALANVVRQDEKWALRVQALVVLRRLRQKKPEAAAG